MARKRNPLAGGQTPAPPGAKTGIAPDGASFGSSLSGGAGGGRIVAAMDGPVDVRCAQLAMTDLGNAERWLYRFGGDFRFCAEFGWFAWDGRRWGLLSEEKDRAPARVMQSIYATVRAIGNEARIVAASGWQDGEDGRPARKPEKLPRGSLDDTLFADWFDKLPALDYVWSAGNKIVLFSEKLQSWARTSEAAGRMAAISTLCKSFELIAVKPDAFDRDRMAINVRNGTLRLMRRNEKRSSAEIEAGKSEWHTAGWKVRLDKHERADLMTKVCNADFRPGAKCPEYDAFIERMQPDEVMRRFIHQWGGLSLTGETGPQKLAFFYGSGRNGKGTWVETIAHIAGDYAGSIPIESFLQSGSGKRGDQATPDIARLPGVRFLRVSEPAQGSTLNEGLIKQVTGQDPVDARHLNKGFFTFLPSFKMTISGNNRPKVKDTSDGIWRRMQMVPWAVQLPKEEVDTDLGNRMRDNEASGILNRLLEGLCDWKEHKLIEPDQVRLATQAYRDDSDELGRFLSQCCEVGGDPKTVRVRVTELFALYEAWSKATGGAGWHNRGFNNALRDKQFERKTSNGEWWIKVRPLPGASVEALNAGSWPPEDGSSDDHDAGFSVNADDVDPFAP